MVGKTLYGGLEMPVLVQKLEFYCSIEEYQMIEDLVMGFRTVRRKIGKLEWRENQKKLMEFHRNLRIRFKNV